MAKPLKIVGIVMVCLVVLAVALWLWTTQRQAVATGYEAKIETGGSLEAKYLAKGPNTDVAVKTIDAPENFKRYLIYYPKSLGEGNESLPVVIISNGTGVVASRCRASMERLASWGFIVIGTDEEYSWNGFSSEMCLRLLIKLNESNSIATSLGWEQNPFYHAVDLENVGVVGHSQGGVGVINAATNTQHKDMVKTVVSLSPTNRELATQLEWDYDPAALEVPTLLVASTGDVDEKTVVSVEQLSSLYRDIPDTVTKVKMRRSGADHGDMLTYADGYVTAWLRWQLAGDEEASKAFVGDGSEILSNPLYQDVEKNV